MAPFTLIIGNKNYSSWSLRHWLALKQAGIEFTEIRIPLSTPESYEQLLRYSPSGKVPVLQHGNLLIWESLAICEYLAELFPDRHLYPQSVEARAVARAVSSEMHAGFAPLRQHMPMDCRSRIPRNPSPEVQADIDRILSIWKYCRQTYGQGGDFLFGEFTIADAMYAPVVSRFTTYGVELDAIAHAYSEAIWAFPAMQEWLADAKAEPEVITY